LGHRAWRGSAIIKPADSITVLTNPLNSTPGSDQLIIHGSLYSSDAERAVVHAFRDGDPSLILKTLSGLQGDYCILSVQGKELAWARSPLGVVPLYQASDLHVHAVASEMKPLVALGLDNIHSVRPGSLNTTSSPQSGHIMEPIEFSLEGDVEGILAQRLTDSVRTRVRGKQVAVGFSGGLDSSLLAYIAQQFTKVKLVGLAGDDSAVLRASASLLSMDLVELCVDEAMVNAHLPFLRYLIETESIMDLSIGMAVYLDAKLAYREGCDTLILGQLADELFGGYLKYVEAMSKHGSEAAGRKMNSDVDMAHQTGFPRDDKASSPFVMISHPYADIGLVKLVQSIPAASRIGLPLYLRKNLLRRIALRIGLPSELAMRPKKAVQYSTRLEKLVRRSAKVRPELLS